LPHGPAPAIEQELTAKEQAARKVLEAAFVELGD
jgi:hypothetical protein